MEEGKRIAVATLGCKVNIYDTQSMLEIFLKNGYTQVNFREQADVYLINTCAVTGLADKKSRQMIRRAKTKNKEAIVIAAGCLSESDKESVERCGADIVLGTRERGKVYEVYQGFLSGKNNDQAYGTLSDVYEELTVTRLSGHTRAFVKIQDGCDNFCAYCIVPYVRGNPRSRGFSECIDECKRLAENGYKEIVLSGIHLASYGRDLPTGSLTDIIAAINDIEGIYRIRLGSLDPRIITDSFIENIAKNEKLCDHFHISLQSGCDNTLIRMERNYDTEFYAAAIEKIRTVFKNSAISTDIIVGFPGETEKDFATCMGFCARMEFSKIHVFPFSAKNGTKAFNMKNQITKEDKIRRAQECKELADALRSRFLDKNAGHTADVLFEARNGNTCEGLTSNYISFKTQSDDYAINSIRNVFLNRNDIY